MKPANNYPANWSPLGYQRITSLSSAVGLTVPTNARIALITAETQAVRWRDDGTDPTAAIGTPLAAGAALDYDGDLSAFKVIEQTGSAVLHVAYYG